MKEFCNLSVEMQGQFPYNPIIYVPSLLHKSDMLENN